MSNRLGHPTHAAVRLSRRRWRMPWIPALSALVVLVGLAVFLYPQTASWFTQREQARVIALELNAWDTPPNDDEQHRTLMLARAAEYNDALASGATLESNAHVPTGSGQSSNPLLDYWSLLSTSDNGVMARLKYEAVGVDMPVYHGTSDETLLEGVGHLEGTSLPVGGEGTRAVLTAHRGLANATMFDHLDEAAIGDTFTVEVLGEVLTYRVRETQVIAPSDTEALFAIPSQDLLTLVTCTPLGVNTHRILVTGERVTPTPEVDVAAAGAVPDLPGFPWWAVIGASGIVLLSGYVWRAGYPARPRDIP